MRTLIPLFLGSLTALALTGCHLRAGFGPPPSAPPSVDHTIIRDTVESTDGSKTITENDTTRTNYDDGRSTTVETHTRTVKGVDGAETHSRSQTTTERSANGSVSTSSTTSGGN